MAFNLPPPWDPGYALPENVSDEGLERRGFVTRWMPRGTYDATRVGTGGYAVPKYVQKEGYGQGAVVTKWAPRGRYDIPVPNWLDQRPKLLKQRSFPGGNTLTFDALSGTDLPALYTSFGKKAARAVLARVADYLQKENQIRARIGSAMAYPMIMMIIGAAVIVVLMTFVVPKISQILIEEHGPR